MNGTAPWHQTFWDWRAAGNFIGGGTGTGLLLITALCALAGGPLQPLLLLALLCVAAGLGMVFLELGRPLRSLNVLFNARTSWMTREAMAAAPLFLFGLLAVVTEAVWLALLAAAAGVVFLYCQGRILLAAKGIPAWRAPRVLPLILTTGVTEGLGLYLLASALLGSESQSSLQAPLLVLLLALLGLRALTWTRYRCSLQNQAPTAALRVLERLNTPFLAAGHGLPGLLALLALLIGAPWIAALAGLSALLGGWWFKFTLITQAAFNQGYAIVHAPRRGAGEPGPGVKPGWS